MKHSHNIDHRLFYVIILAYKQYTLVANYLKEAKNLRLYLASLILIFDIWYIFKNYFDMHIQLSTNPNHSIPYLIDVSKYYYTVCLWISFCKDITIAIWKVFTWYKNSDIRKCIPKTSISKGHKNKTTKSFFHNFILQSHHNTLVQ